MARFLRSEWSTHCPAGLIVVLLTRLGISRRGSRILAVRDRTSGAWRQTTVQPLSLAGQRYLVALHGNAPWARNLRVSGGGVVRLGRRAEPVRAVEIADAEKPPILRAYLQHCKGEAGKIFAVSSPDATDDEFRRIAADHPVFRMTKVEPSSVRRDACDVTAAGRTSAQRSDRRAAVTRRSPREFFLLLFALSIPFWLFGAMVERGLPLPLKLPVSALSFICPLITALILVYREDKMSGVRRLLQRVVDYRRIRPKIWYMPIIFLLPGIYLLSYVVMRLLGRPLPEPHIPFLMIPILIVVFFIGAVGEEAGYTGYVLDPMQERWSALATGILLGLAWGLMHVTPDLQNRHSPTWIAWQRGVYSIALRILIVWLYNNTGKSVFASILFHDTDNVSVSLFPNNGSHYDPAVTGVITAITAAIVTFFWGARTLARRWD